MNDTLVTDFMHVQTTLDAPGVRLATAQYRWPATSDAVLVSDGSFRLELALSSRDPSWQGCYPSYWHEARFQTIGEMFLLPPGQRLRMQCGVRQTLDTVVCHLDRSLFFDMYMKHLKAGYPFKEGDAALYLPASLDLRDAHVRRLLVAMAHEARIPGIASKDMIVAMATQLVVELLRIGATVGAPKQQGGLAGWQLRAIEERLRHVGPAPSLAELAALCKISVRHLTRGFKESRGCTIGSFVSQRHMDHARRLLAEGGSIAAIAGHLGFSASSGFCLAFRRETGLTPGEFRTKLLTSVRGTRIPEAVKRETAGLAIAP